VRENIAGITVEDSAATAQWPSSIAIIKSCLAILFTEKCKYVMEIT